MAKAQYPIDGKPGKDWKVTSLMGFRIHPVLKTKKHHNGTDIWAPAEPCWIEAPYDAKVVKVSNNPSGFGNSVQLQMKIDGKFYVSIFAHMKDGSVKVKKGQKIEAGTPLGKMGSTGMSTGKHLHWELQLGKTYAWNDKGKNFIEPVAFFKAVIAKEKIQATAPVVANDNDPVAEAPIHGNAPEVAPVAPVAAPEAIKAPAIPAAPAPAKKAIPGYTVKSGDSYWAIAEKFAPKHGAGKSVGEYTKHLQTINKGKALKPGDKIRLA